MLGWQHYGYGLRKGEIEQSLGGHVDFLAVGEGLKGHCPSTSDTGTDGCTFTATGKTANKRANACAYASPRGSLFSSGLPHLLHCAAGQVVGLALVGEASKSERELTAAFNLAGLLGRRHLQGDVSTFAHDDRIPNHNRRCQ
jgi:hypothetical protein